MTAKVLKESARQSDLPARFGGEELILVLPAADLVAAEKIGEKIRRTISECRITKRSTGALLPRVTVSVGVAQLRSGETMADLIKRCDHAPSSSEADRQKSYRNRSSNW